MSGNIYLILEETGVISSVGYGIEILEQKNITENVSKVVFKARLQTAEEINQNKRFYRRPILEQIVRILQPKAKSRSLFQEVDHPLVVTASDTDSPLMKKRAVTVEIKNSGTLIRDIYMEKNDVIGIIETLSGFKGPDIFNLLVRDKANIGFSLRMFARLVPDPNNNVMVVEPPLRPITYDIVSNPSHTNANILEFLPEDFANLTSLNSLVAINESSDIFGDEFNIPVNDFNLYLREIIENAYRSNRICRLNI